MGFRERLGGDLDNPVRVERLTVRGEDAIVEAVPPHDRLEEGSYPLAFLFLGGRWLPCRPARSGGLGLRALALAGRRLGGLGLAAAFPQQDPDCRRAEPALLLRGPECGVGR